MAIPDSNGVIHGAYRNSTGDLRVLDSNQSPRSDETRLDWNQQGPKGDKGDPGDPGAPGAPAETVWAWCHYAFLPEGGSLSPGDEGFEGSGIVRFERDSYAPHGAYTVVFDRDLAYNDGTSLTHLGSIQATIQGQPGFIAVSPGPDPQGSSTSHWNAVTVNCFPISGSNQPADFVDRVFYLAVIF